MTSAGCDTTAQKIPAIYPPTNETYPNISTRILQERSSIRPKKRENLCLNEFSIFVFWFGESRVNVFNDSFKRSEFHHSIRNLSSPKRLQPFIQSNKSVSYSSCGSSSEVGEFLPSHSFGGGNFIPTFKSSTSKRGNSSLHTNLNSFPRT